VSYDLEPVVGSWYRLVDKGDLFRVVGVDGDNDTVEVRWFDGDVEELDTGGWFEMDLEQAEAPEGWTDSGEDLEDDDDEKPAKKGGAARDDDDDRPRGWDDDEDKDEDDEDDDDDDNWGDDDDDDR
jgi:hypothetical protein